MFQNTKFLIYFSLLIVFLGFGLIYFGLKPADQTPKTSDTSSITSSTTPIPTFNSQSEPIATQSAVAGLEGERAYVSKVVDGDTINVLINNQPFTVRFVGIDTPETVDPRRPVGCFGKEASNETK